MKNDKIQILRVLVGSRAHGLHTKNSDHDYRGIFAYNTRDLVSVRPPKDQTSWIEGKEDDTSWEIGKFLTMALKCNPSVLEVFLSPVAPIPVELKTDRDWAYATESMANGIRELFPYVWNSKDVMNAYIGYGLNQRKKFLDDRETRRAKYAVAYLRSLYNAWQLLTTGTFSIDMSETEEFSTLKRWKSGQFTIGEVIDKTAYWTDKVKEAYEKNPDHQPDIERVNDFLVGVRRALW